MWERGSRGGWLLVVALVGVATAWAVSSQNAERRTSASPPPAPPRRESPRRPSVPPRRAHATQPPPAPVSATAPAGCPEDDADPPDFVRPSIWDLLQLRTQELRDRLPQLQRDASSELRAGLSGITGDQPQDAVETLRSAPDRERDGFDVAVAAMLHLGMRALGQRDATEARTWAELAAREAPQDAGARALAGLVAEAAGRGAEAARHLASAYRLQPDEPAIAIAHARRAADQGDFRDALEAVDAYLSVVPDDARSRSWRARISARAALTRRHARRTDGRLTAIWPDRSVDVRRVNDVSREVLETIRVVANRTRLPRRDALVIVIYDSAEDMRRATCAPSWSGGVFDGLLHLDAATVRSDHYARVVRHEATHAQLATVRRRIPSWLGEGFAQEMEGPASPQARRAWRRMVEREYWIPLSSLEGALIEIEDSEDAGLAYHQSLAMFLLLRDRGGPDAVARAFTHVAAGEPEDLLERIVEDADGRTLLEFMAQLQVGP